MKVVAFVLWGLFTSLCHGGPSIASVRAIPSTVVVGTPAQISVQASITDPLLIPNSINLLQMNVDGATTVLASLHDDGINGDTYAGDLIFTASVTLNSAMPAQFQLQVSAAFKSQLVRVRSQIVNVFFQAADAPQQALKSLAQSLTDGDTARALNYVVPSENTVLALTTFDQNGLNALASILNSAVQVASQSDLLIFKAPFITAAGTIVNVEVTMVPGGNGQWLVNTW